MFQTMKKSIALLVAVLALFTLVACSDTGEAGGDEEVTLVGDWMLSSFADAEGNEYTVEDFAEMNGLAASDLEIAYNFAEDGTMSMTMMGIEVSGTYEFDGSSVSMTFEGQTSTSTYDADADEIVTSDPTTGMESRLSRS